MFKRSARPPHAEELGAVPGGLEDGVSESEEDDVAVVSAPAPPRDAAVGFCDCACTLRRLLEGVVGGRRRTAAELRP